MVRWLTGKQRRVLEVLVEHIRLRGSVPTAQGHVIALERKGYVTRAPRQARTLRVVRHADEGAQLAQVDDGRCDDPGT